jgi:hypothetical protein
VVVIAPPPLPDPFLWVYFSFAWISGLLFPYGHYGIHSTKVQDSTHLLGYGLARYWLDESLGITGGELYHGVLVVGFMGLGVCVHGILASQTKGVGWMNLMI